MTTFNKFFKKSSKIISNDKILSTFMRQTSHIKPSPKFINKITPLQIFSPSLTGTDEIGRFILKELDEESKFGIEDGVKSKYFFQRFNILELSCLVFSLMGLGFAIISYDMGFIQETGFTEMPTTLQPDDLDSIRYMLLWLTLISTCFLYPLVLIRYKLKIQWLQSKKLLSFKDNLYSTGDIYFLLLELTIYNLIPTPFYSGYTFESYNEGAAVSTVYSYNEFFSLLILLRVFMVFRILLANSRYYTNSAHRICQLTGCENGYLFVIKSLMKNNPLQVLVTALFISIITFAYALKVCERPLIFAITQKQKLLLKPGQALKMPLVNDVSNYYNSMWLMIGTMTTVGYGDFYPRTMPGRAIAFFACMFGVIVVSLMTITLFNLMEMSNSETRCYNIIERIGVEREKKKHAAYVITNLTKLGFWNGILKKHLQRENIQYHVKQMKKHLKIFQQLSADRVGILSIRKNIEEEVSRHFMFIREDHKNLEDRINKLCEKNLSILENIGYLEKNDEISEDFLSATENKVLYTPWLKKNRYKNFNTLSNIKENI